MTLRNKTLIIIGILLIGIVTILYFASSSIILGSFHKLEAEGTRKSVATTLDFLSETINGLIALEGEYSIWDQTCEYIENHNVEYLKSNFTRTIFVENRLNILLIFDKRGRAILKLGYDLANDRQFFIPEDLLKQLLQNKMLLSHRDIESKVAGIISLPKGPMLIVSRPVVTSNNSGPIRGTIIMGRYLNKTELKRVAKKVHLTLGLRSFNSRRAFPDAELTKAVLPGEKSVVVKAVDNHSIVGYTLLKDISGKPVAILKVASHRSFYQQGVSNIRYFIISLLAIGMVFGSASVILLEKGLLKRLHSLTENIISIGASRNVAERVNLKGRDELSNLAGQINDMLDALEYSQSELRQSEERYRSVVNSVKEVIFQINTTGIWTFLNPAWKNITGFDVDETIGRSAFAYIHHDDYERNLNFFRTLFEGKNKYSQHEIRVITKSGEARWVDVFGRLTFDASGSPIGVSGTFNDIHERKIHEEKIRYQAYHDPLTGLPNRLLFKDRLANAIALSRRNGDMLAVMFLDLDQYKQVNDTLGHDIGDLLLQDVARRLESCTREIDTVARLGGDEFTFILTQLKHKIDATIVAQRIIDILEMPFVYNSHELHIGVSIGISFYPHDGRDVKDLMKAADTAMYNAKKQGGNRYEFI